MEIIWILTFTLAISSVLCEENASDDNPMTMLVKNLDKTKYKIRPNYGGDAVEVRVGVYANSFSVDDKTMEYEVSFYLRETWNDTRLAFESEDYEEINVEDSALREKIWVPDLFFRSDVDTRMATEEMGNSLMKIRKDGRIWYVRKLHSRQKCPMNLRKFPFDQQWCPLTIESFGYKMEELVIGFIDKPLDVAPEVKFSLERYSMVDRKFEDCSRNYTGGSFPCKLISFCMRRDVGYFLLQLYLPSLLLVALTWLSFWVSVKSHTPRLTLIIVMLLTLIVLCYVTKADLPKVSYATGLDVWNIACVMLVLLALVEFLLVYCIDTYFKKDDCGKAAGGEEEAGTSTIVKTFKPAGAPCVEVIDRCCRLVFPIVFLLFNIIYWSVITCRD